MTDGTSHYNADLLANNLFTTLTAGSDFTLPAVDLSTAAFTYPAAAALVEGTTLTEADLTERLVGGAGMFDGLMEAMKGHLREEYEKGRITGNEYATAYVSNTSTALSAAVQYLLQKDNAHWQAQLVQMQARAAEVALVTARIQAEIAKAELIKSRLETNTVASNYALSKMQLATENEKYRGLELQNAQTTYQTDVLMPTQVASATKQNEKLDFEIDFLLPKELLKADKSIELMTSQISTSTAQKDQVLYQTASILPAQKLGYEADTALKDYQLGSLLPAQTAGHTADNVAKTYTNTFLLPEQLISLKEQNEGLRSKTMDTRMDGITPVAGAVGMQNALYDQQIISYKRDAETKVGKMLLDTWITQMSINEDTLPPTSLSNDRINTVIEKLYGNLALVT